MAFQVLIFPFVSFTGTQMADADSDRLFRVDTDAQRGIGRYMDFYNEERPHQALGYATPHAIHFGARARAIA
ncbi:MAG: integrase core domain-containing protein [Phycisphaerae bacterium]